MNIVKSSLKKIPKEFKKRMTESAWQALDNVVCQTLTTACKTCNKATITDMDIFTARYLGR